jgi:ABC-type transporter Mla subunit MlaD
MPWKAAAMPDEHRLTIRLPQELYAQLASCGWPGQPVAAIVRQALQEYVARQTEQPRSSDETAVTLAAMAARLDGLQDQVESLATRLESLAANTRQTMADVADTIRQIMADTAARTRQPAADMADIAPTAADTPAPPRRPGRPSGLLRQQILDLLQAHPAGLRAEEIRVYLQARRPIDDTLQGMLKGGVITAQGQGIHRRYVRTE